jgi:putative transposase
MYNELRDRGHSVGKTRVERVMRENGIRARHKRRWKVTTDSKHGLPVAANLIARDFSPAQPNQSWGADITYIWTDEGWLYLAVVLDFFNREIVGWCLQQDLSATLVCDALSMAWFRRRPAPGLIHHSDRGVQYASHEYIDQLKQIHAQISMSSVDNPYDNAKAESFFKTLKQEEVYLKEYRSFEDAEANLAGFLEQVYNIKRLHSSLGYLPHAEFEATYTTLVSEKIKC